MQTIRKYIFSICVASLCIFTFGSCSEEVVEPAVVDSPTTTILVSKRGLDYNGGEVTLDVKSNTYWKINYDEEAIDWLSISPRAASGDCIVSVVVSPNDRDERTAKLSFDTLDGIKLEISLYQGAYGEVLAFYRETFGNEAVATPVTVDEFNGWGRSGFGAEMISYSGNATISSEFASAGYEGASGGNALLFGEETTFELGPVELRGDRYFHMDFGACNTLGTFDASALKVEVSVDGEDWYPFKYTATDSADWGLCSATFYVVDVERMYMRFAAPAGYAIDDLLITEGNSSEPGYELEFSYDGDDNFKVGHVYFADNFDWVTYEFGGTDYIANPALNNNEVRFDNVYTLPANLVEIFSSAGWTQPDNDAPVYLRLGYVKVGRSKSKGILLSPKLSNIREGRSVYTELSFKATMYEANNGVRDMDNICVEVIGGGTINSAEKTSIELPIGLFNSWPSDPFKLKIYNATHDTQIAFKTLYSAESQTAVNLSNRFFIDEVQVSKLAKTGEIIEEWNEVLATPELSAANTSASSSSVAASWQAIDHAFSYEYIARNETGTIIEQNTVASPSLVVNGLATGHTYTVCVRALPHAESLRYTASAWSDEVAIETIDKDTHPYGYVFFEDRFDYLDENFSLTANWATPFTDMATDDTTLQKYVSAENITMWKSKGYTHTGRTYMNIGNLKIGRTVSDNKNVGDHTGRINLPMWALQDIDEDAAISVKFEFDAAFFALNDSHIITVLCSNGERYDVPLTSETIKTWDSYSVVLHNVTSSSTVSFITYEWKTNTPNRVYLDNFRLSKYDAAADLE